jgi:hypothetical protein
MKDWRAYGRATPVNVRDGGFGIAATLLQLTYGGMTMQAQTHKLLGSFLFYVVVALILVSGVSVQAQDVQPSVVGAWQGVMYSNLPAANGASAQCVFFLTGEFSCMVSKPGFVAVRQWGRYRVMANEIEFEIEGHEPESVTMPATDHSEIVSLTAYALTTRAFAEGIYTVLDLRRVQ